MPMGMMIRAPGTQASRNPGPALATDQWNLVPDPAKPRSRHLHRQTVPQL